MRSPRTNSKPGQAGLASVEAVLVFTFIYLVFIVVIFQSVKLSYVSMDGLIAARNAAWKQETYFAADDAENTFVNVGAILKQAAFGDSTPFLDGTVRSVHAINVIAFSGSDKGAMQESILEPVRKGLDGNKTDSEQQDTDTAKGKINLNKMTRILEDFDFKGVKGTSLATEVKLLGIYAGDDETNIPSLAILKGGLIEAIASLAGRNTRAHYTDFQGGWNLPTDEERQEKLTTEYRDRFVYRQAYDRKLSEVVGKKHLFSQSIPGS